MELRIAKAISYIFHPLFIPFYTILVLLNTDDFISFVIPVKGQMMLVGIILFTTVLLPLLTSFLLIRVKIIQSFFPNTREERIYLLLNVAVFYYLTYYVIKGTHVSVIFDYFMLGSTALVVCSLIITIFYRISLHMVAAGGLLGGILGLTIGHSMNLMGFILALLFFAGLTGTARLIIDPEKPAGVYYGFLVGITVMFLLFILV